MRHAGRLTCEEAFRRLDDYLDRELSPLEIRLVEEHLAICTSCAEEYGFEASLLQGLRQKLGEIRVPSETVEQILESLDESDNPRGD